MTIEDAPALKARRGRPLLSTGRSNERVLCGRVGCGAQIGWIERVGADPNAFRDGDSMFFWDGPLACREGTRVRTYQGPPVPFPEEYDFMVFRAGYAFIDDVWMLSSAARDRAAKRRQDIDRSGIGDHGRVDASKVTPNKLPAMVECPACRMRQVLDPKALAVSVLKLQRDL